MIKLTYIGKRLNGDKLVQAFLTPSGDTIYFKNVKCVRVGYQYLSKSEDTIPTRPDEGDLHPDYSNHIDQWNAAELAAIAFNRRRLASKKVGMLVFKHKTLGEIREIANTLNASEKREFREAILDYLIFGK